MTDLDRLLEVIAAELGSDDARMELGGRDPAEPDAVWCRTEEGHRVRAIFDGELPEPAGLLCEKLEALVAAFGDTLDASVETSLGPSDPQHALDESLDVLAAQTRAIAAVVVDDSSPVIWGSSLSPRGPEDVRDAHELAEILIKAQANELELVPLLAGGDPPQGLPLEIAEYLVHAHAVPELRARDAESWIERVRVLKAVADVRAQLDGEQGHTRLVEHDDESPYLARNFSGPYWLVLVFAVEDFSELHAEAAAIHATPWLARLVEALPPVDPGGGGKVIKMRRLRPV